MASLVVDAVLSLALKAEHSDIRIRERDGFRYGQISTCEKKNAISCAAFSGESEPCTELASIDSAKSLRIVPGSALAGSVAPITSRFLATAFSPSSTCTTTGPEEIGRASCRERVGGQGGG